ncbi:hypothetical protein D9M73_142070 [compost metagenome]
MGFRQVELLLDAVAQADTEPFATAEGDQCLAELVARAVLVGPGVDEVGQALHPVALAGHHQHAGGEYGSSQGNETHQVDPTEEQHCDARAHQYHGGAEVRFRKQQDGDRAQHQHRLDEAGEFLAHLVLATHQVAGNEHHGEQLGQLGRLQVEQAETDPALGAIDFPTDARQQDQDQQNEGGQHQASTMALPEGHGNLQRDQAGDDTDGQVNQVADHVV